VKALTVKQPYAWFITCLEDYHLRKDIENRSRDTKVRGTIAIHAGRDLQPDVIIPAGMEEVLVFSAIIGVVDIVDVVTEHESRWFTGPYGYVLENPRELPEPIPCKGQLGFWNVPPEIEAQIQKQLGEQK